MIFDLSSCSICPKNCKVNRKKGEKGFCRGGLLPKITRASLHMWEEPSISGEKGSGTVFFSGCNLGCVYCQNYEISRSNMGKEADFNRLCDIFFKLYEKGAHNINLVTPTHFLPEILKAVELSKKKGIKIPFVYNTSGYESVESLKRADGLIDIYLADFKYISHDLAKKYSHAPDYPDIVKAALSEMIRQNPECVFDENGLMQKGVIVRHLMIPNCISDSKRVLKYLAKFKDQIFLSIMNQFTPTPALVSYPEINRKVFDIEYQKLIDFALELGFEKAYIQEGDTAKLSFIPDFNVSEIDI